jgi:hypothetical protein
MTTSRHRRRVKATPRSDRVVWPVEDTPTQPLPAVQPDPSQYPNEPFTAAIAFLSVNGNARRYLERNPECGPYGCPRCCQHAVRCATCRVAAWAWHVLEMRRAQERRPRHDQP